MSTSLGRGRIGFNSDRGGCFDELGIIVTTYDDEACRAESDAMEFSREFEWGCQRCRVPWNGWFWPNG